MTLAKRLQRRMIAGAVSTAERSVGGGGVVHRRRESDAPPGDLGALARAEGGRLGQAGETVEGVSEG